MREILELCASMNELAGELYTSLAERCDDAPLRDTFRAMARDEGEFSSSWYELAEAWDMGLLPDAVNDTTLLQSRLTTIEEEVSRAVAGADAELDCAHMLALAARLELNMIDPVFDEIVNLTEPALTGVIRGHLHTHLQRLIGAIADQYSETSLEGLLAATLSRVWEDNSQLANKMARDQLTGLYNRRVLANQLPHWLAWSARYGRPFAMMLVDVDEFRTVNDTYGHAAGDEALAAVGGALFAATRASDLVIRYGGDEFAIFAPETSEHQYAQLCERLTDTVRNLFVRAPDGSRVELTISIGGTVVTDPAGSPPRSAADLIAAADRSLYTAKSAGRDCAARPVLLAS